jgi:hypothetical protein
VGPGSWCSMGSHIKPQSSSPHCRICGYRPRAPQPGEPDFRAEVIYDHMESRHPYDALGFAWETTILLEQKQGDESHCKFHGGSLR